MKLKYWMMTIVVAAAVAVGGIAISQEEWPAPLPVTTTTPAFLVACFSTAKGSTTLTALNFLSVTTSSETLPSCGSLHRLVINGTEE